MKNMNDKLTQLCVWMKGLVQNTEEEFCFLQVMRSGVNAYSWYCFMMLLLKALKYVLFYIYLGIPYIIQFIECLISALSYSLYKKEFFYGI